MYYLIKRYFLFDILYFVPPAAIRDMRILHWLCYVLNLDNIVKKYIHPVFEFDEHTWLSLYGNAVILFVQVFDSSLNKVLNVWFHNLSLPGFQYSCSLTFLSWKGVLSTLFVGLVESYKYLHEWKYSNLYNRITDADPVFAGEYDNANAIG